MRLDYRILNVFTAKSGPTSPRLTGNPLCVFEDGSALSEPWMQAIARQLNLSETTFLLPATDPSATARVRIFTPSFEMPFAGHPTLGTAHVVRALRGGESVVLEMKAGLVPVTSRGDEWTLRAAKTPATRPAPERDVLATMLGISAADVGERPLWVNTGSEQLIVPLRSVDAVRAVTPDPRLLAQWGSTPERANALVYVWAAEPGSSARDARYLVRFFFTSQGAVLEDPATGSACANLGGYFVATGAALPHRASLSQGEQVGRPSTLGLVVDEAGAVFVSGAVIELGRGTFEL